MASRDFNDKKMAVLHPSSEPVMSEPSQGCMRASATPSCSSLLLLHFWEGQRLLPESIVRRADPRAIRHNGVKNGNLLAPTVQSSLVPHPLPMSIHSGCSRPSSLPRCQLGASPSSAANTKAFVSSLAPTGNCTILISRKMGQAFILPIGRT